MEMNQRPRVLEALCMMTFLGSGGGTVIYLLSAIFYGKASDIILKYSSLSSMDEISALYFLLHSLFFAISLYGTIQMWKLKKSGFFIYLAAQLAIFFHPMAWMGKSAFSAVGLIFTLLFVIAYLSQFKKLKT